MLARIRKSMEEKDQGFTLIELLVVMIIIGILAAIAIPVFLNQRKKAQDSAAKADVSTIGKEVATWYVDNTAAPALTVDRSATATRPVPDRHRRHRQLEQRRRPRGDERRSSPTPRRGASPSQNAGGDKAVVGYKYSAAGGLAEGACATAAG